MGNAPSKRGSDTSTIPRNTDTAMQTCVRLPRSPASPQLAIFPDTSECPSDPGAQSAPRYGHARMQCETEEYGISLPVRRQHVRQLSELIDPTTLFAENDYVKSPSGNLLGRTDFVAREDRPLSLRERQERIRQQLDKEHKAPLSSQAANFTMYAIPEEPVKLEPQVKPKATKTTCWCF